MPFRGVVVLHVSKHEGSAPMTLIILRGLTGSGKSTVATILANRYSHVVEIGIDKIREENATESCCFPEAGRRTKCQLEKGFAVIVHDAFYNQKYLKMFLNPTGLSLTDNSVHVFRFECGMDEAIERSRKKTDPEVKPQQVKEQYLKTMENLPYEVIISTSDKSENRVADDIARQVGLAN